MGKYVAHQGRPDACLVKRSVRMIQQGILINKQKLYVSGLTQTRIDYFHLENSPKKARALIG